MEIVFVCTGNIFRSLAAERFLKSYCVTHGLSWSVASAGTIARPSKVHSLVVADMLSRGYDVTDHIQHTISEICSPSKTVIAMAEDHQRILRERYAIETSLFDELAYHTHTSVPDVVGMNDGVVPAHAAASIHAILDHIELGIQALAQRLIDLGQGGRA